MQNGTRDARFEEDELCLSEALSVHQKDESIKDGATC
jgi:hypothetical protein